VLSHRRAPGVEHGGDADARAEMASVGGDGEYGLRRRPEQQVVHDRLVVESDVGEFGGNAEDDVEVSDRQQVGLALGQPGVRGGSLALGAVPIAAAVIPAALSPDSSLGLVESANLRFPAGRELRKGMWRHGHGD
jgi:hypothetical protein